MALLPSMFEPPEPSDYRHDPGYQRWLEHLERTTVGEPGQPRANPEPDRKPPEAAELVDGTPPEPKPEPKRRRKPPKLEEPAQASRDLRLLVRKLKGQE